MILRLLWIIQIIRKMFIKILDAIPLKITIQIKKVLIVFDDMNADIINNKKLNSIVTELFIRVRKRNISIVFVTLF